MSAFERKRPHYLKHRFSIKSGFVRVGKWSRTHFVFAATTSSCPLLSILLPRYFSARRRLQNDKFSTLKKDFRCLKGTFCAALSFRLRFASLDSSPSPFSLSFSLDVPVVLPRSQLHPSLSCLCCASPFASSLQIYNALACNKRLCASFTIMSSLQVPRGLIELRPFRNTGPRR